MTIKEAYDKAWRDLSLVLSRLIIPLPESDQIKISKAYDPPKEDEGKEGKKSVK